MFSISAKGIYGISAVLELALRIDDGPVQIRDIATAQKIPQHYLEQILVVLKRGGVVKSYRGAQGGYALAGSSRSIRLLDVMTLLEGPLDIAPGDKGDPRLQFLWQALTDDLRQQLNINIADLVDAVQNTESQLNFII